MEKTEVSAHHSIINLQLRKVEQASRQSFAYQGCMKTGEFIAVGPFFGMQHQHLRQPGEGGLCFIGLQYPEGNRSHLGQSAQLASYIAAQTASEGGEQILRG